LRIAILYQFIYPQSFGGGEKRLFEVFSRFPESITLDWYPQYSENYDDYSQLKRFNIFPFEKSSKSKNFRSIKKTLIYAWHCFRVDLSKYDYVHIGQMPFFHILPILLKSMISHFLGLKAATVSVDWWEFCGSHWDKFNIVISLFGKMYERLILFYLDRAIVISDKTENDIKKYMRDKTVLIHNGVDLASINAAPIGPESDIVLLGRLEKWKNTLFSIEVFKVMLDINDKLKMKIIGSGQQENEINLFIKENNLENNIEMLGFLPNEIDIYSILKGSKLMMLFSWQEGGGSITLFEGNACGLPVATAFYPNGIDKEIVTVENGFYFENKSVEDIANELTDYLSSETKITSLKKSSRVFIEKFDWDQISKEYLNYFHYKI
jgi:glycosyltransferase involved in cell wall biosynthesis